MRSASAVSRERQEKQRQLAEAAHAAEERRAAMAALAKAEMVPTEYDLEAHALREQTNARAVRLIEEDEDEVKALNTLIASAKVFAVREAQLAEKVACLSLSFFLSLSHTHIVLFFFFLFFFV